MQQFVVSLLKMECPRSKCPRCFRQVLENAIRLDAIQKKTLEIIASLSASGPRALQEIYVHYV